MRPLAGAHRFIVHIPLFKLISKSNLPIFLLTMFIIYIGVTTVTILVSHDILSEVITKKEKRLLELKEVEDLPASVMCQAVDCIAYRNVTRDLNTYFSKDHEILPDELIPNMIDNTKSVLFNPFSVIKIGDNEYFINESDFLIVIAQSSRVAITWLSILIIIVYIVLVFVLERVRVYEHTAYKYSFESRLQRNVAESLYHELNQPIALIRVLLQNMYYTAFPKTYNRDEFSFKIEALTDEDKAINLEEFKKEMVEGNYALFNALDRMRSTLDVVASSKHIRYSNGTVSLLDIVQNAIAGVNTTKVNKLAAEYNNKSILNHYSMTGGLNNGDMLNILNIMINNSSDAGATKITFSATYTQPYLYLYVKDNGRGVRDNKGNIVSSTDIFSYGYSTKGDPKLQPGLINRILNKFRLDITGARTVRGVGLSINKELLQSYNGDIILYETSPKGTTFIVKIPVKKTEKKNS